MAKLKEELNHARAERDNGIEATKKEAESQITTGQAEAVEAREERDRILINQKRV